MRWTSLVGGLSGAAVFVLVATLGTLPALADPSPRPAPAVALPDRDGAMTTLQSLRGKVVLVDVWASWCVPCRAAFPAYDGLYREYRDHGFEVLAVNVDEQRAAADRFLEGRKYQVHVLFDPKGTTPAGFSLRAMPTSYLIDKKGMIRFSHEGFTEKRLAQYRREIEQLIAETP